MKLLLAAVFAALLTAACGYPDPYATSNAPVADESPPASAAPSVSPGADDFNTCNTLSATTYPDGLKVGDLKAGTGDAAKSGENAEVQYTGWLQSNGTSFDSSRQPGRTSFTFQIGQSQVIAGWDEGLLGMKVGGKRCLRIPSDLAYGAQGSTNQQTGAVVIPPNAPLVFEIELISLAPGPSPSPTPSASASPSPSASPSK
ncbi:MAG TPA: FKBP-type peptidyl-prolyl cis-trans isomerase [Candidatus Dormibacteraeota bacterium]|nr:FKBP-type peptidyl-prolyl cis-trans isomerase [Candidatus Dormibacteraeota bacterium]